MEYPKLFEKDFLSMSYFGNSLKRIRKEKGITQEALALKLGVTKGMISQYENGNREPKLDTIKKIAAALDCNMNVLISKETILDIIQEEKTEKEQIEKLSTFYQLSTNEIAEIIENYIMYHYGSYDDNKEIIDIFSKLNILGRDKVIQYASDLLENPKYQNGYPG